MTGRELLKHCLAHRAIARLPVAPFIHANFVRAFYQDHNVDVMAKTPEVYMHFGFDLVHRNCTPAYSEFDHNGKAWQVDTAVVSYGRGETATNTIHTPKGTLR